VSGAFAALTAITLFAGTPATEGRLPAAHRPDSVSVPILIYHVIAPAPAGAPFPGLYVPAAQFASQMEALAAAGYNAVTLDQVWRAWHGEAELPARPVVISFDNGYRTQYTRAFPVLRRLGWVGDENLQLSGLPPAQGGLSVEQIRGLVSAHWELDTQGYSHVDLIGLSSAQLRFQIAAAGTTIRRRFHVRADWFCYPSGDYNATVVAEVRAAGYVGATTVASGWARPGEDPYRLPRLRVLTGTSPQGLLALITDARVDPPPPVTYPPRGQP
jgi:peptidoglycan/xylan/chitin deacetylase (PgdA/CDA1 family)